jgi:hypothetical protein
MTLLDDGPPEIEHRDRESAVDVRYLKGIDLETLESLQDTQLHERRYLQSIERNGGSGRVVEFLYSQVEQRELEIIELRAKLSSAGVKASSHEGV